MSVTFGDVFADLQKRLGKDPTATMSDPLPAQYALALSDGVRVGWQAAFWPRVMQIEERTPELTEAGYRVIAWQQAGKTEIEAVELERCLYERDPRAHTGAAPLRHVFTTPEGIIVPDYTTAERLYARFRPPAPEYTEEDTDEEFPAFLRRYAVLQAASELLDDDQARYRTKAAAESELERLIGVEFDLAGEDRGAIK